MTQPKVYETLKDSPGLVLADAVRRLQRDYQEGRLTRYNFNGTWLYSDTVEENAAYIQVTGQPKSWHDEQFKKIDARAKNNLVVEKLRKETEDFVGTPPKITQNDVTAAALTLLLRSEIITQEELDTAQEGGYDGLFQLIGTKYAKVKEEGPKGKKRLEKMDFEAARTEEAIMTFAHKEGFDDFREKWSNKSYSDSDHNLPNLTMDFLDAVKAKNDK